MVAPSQQNKRAIDADSPRLRHKRSPALTHRILHTLATVGACAVTLSLVACDHPATNVKTELPQRKEGEEAPSVSLPTAPPASGYIIPEKNDDGTMRILGMAHHKQKYIDKTVTVKGTVTFISEDCDPAKAKKNKTKCPEPYMTIEDSDKLPMLVVGYPAKFLKKAKVKADETYDFKGTYKLAAQGFTATEDGLLLLDEVNEKSVIEK